MLNDQESRGTAGPRRTAHLYELALQGEQVYAASAYEDSALVAFAYGHPWRWSEQQYAWAHTLRERIGEPAAAVIDGSCALNLLARSPGARGRGLGRDVLTAWLGAIRPRSCWLQTTDGPTPAHRVYLTMGFETIGHGPDAPDGRPGLVLFRRADDGDRRPAHRDA